MAGKGKIVRGALEGLTDIFTKGDDAPVDPSRRAFVKGVGAVGAAGALGGIKAGTKLIDNIPAPVKKEAVTQVENLFSTKSWDSLFGNLAEQYEHDFGSELLYDELENFLFSGNSGRALKDFISGKIDIDDLDDVNDNLPILIQDLLDEGFDNQQVKKLLSQEINID